MEPFDPMDRVARAIARLVWAYPGSTPGATRRRLPYRDRPLFIEAAVQAVKLQLVTVDDAGLLRPGSAIPGAAPRNKTSAMFAIALRRRVES
jgi:hypothetical protein